MSYIMFEMDILKYLKVAILSVLTASGMMMQIFIGQL